MDATVEGESSSMKGTEPLRPDTIVHELYARVNVALQRWGRYTSTDYASFQPIVALQLAFVEPCALALTTSAQPPRTVTDTDRQQAIWYLLRAAIETLRPPVNTLAPAVQAPLQHLHHQCWPRDLRAPQECHHYLVLFLAYVAKSHANKELASIFQVSVRTLATIRTQAITVIAHRVAQWEVEYQQRTCKYRPLPADWCTLLQPHTAPYGVDCS